MAQKMLARRLLPRSTPTGITFWSTPDNSDAESDAADDGNTAFLASPRPTPAGPETWAERFEILPLPPSDPNECMSPIRLDDLQTDSLYGALSSTFDVFETPETSGQQQQEEQHEPWSTSRAIELFDGACARYPENGMDLPSLSAADIRVLLREIEPEIPCDFEEADDTMVLEFGAVPPMTSTPVRINTQQDTEAGDTIVDTPMVLEFGAVPPMTSTPVRINTQLDTEADDTIVDTPMTSTPVRINTQQDAEYNMTIEPLKWLVIEDYTRLKLMLVHLLYDALMKHAKSKCDGCALDDLSQMHHTCLYVEDRNFYLYANYEAVTAELCNADFLHTLSTMFFYFKSSATLINIRNSVSAILHDLAHEGKIFTRLRAIKQEAGDTVLTRNEVALLFRTFGKTQWEVL
ncbi:uncharacterized protein [Syngnathus scovelli]|uniref:uncharacterized protein n=1 Tax=Syngnathus scovelli TaxID=161590 RepID=UPI0021100EEB|nr:uncharacterized protein LOC125975090 [Syngnathus scovelli]